MGTIRALPALMAALAIAGCGGQRATSSGHTAAASPPSCHALYHAWQHGPARAEGKKLTAALDAVQSASSADDITLMASGLERAARWAKALEAYPMPACADPHGYWRQILALVRASGDNAKSAGNGLLGLLAAEVPLKKVPALETKLKAELKSTGAQP